MAREVTAVHVHKRHLLAQAGVGCGIIELVLSPAGTAFVLVLEGRRKFDHDKLDVYRISLDTGVGSIRVRVRVRVRVRGRQASA